MFSYMFLKKPNSLHNLKQTWKYISSEEKEIHEVKSEKSAVSKGDCNYLPDYIVNSLIDVCCCCGSQQFPCCLKAKL